MGRSYSLDLRQRLIDRVTSGQSRRGAAEDLAVSASFAVKLAARHEQTGSLAPAAQGRPAGTGKLDPYRDFLIGRVKEKPDITMPELAIELAAKHGVAADPASLSRFLCKAGFSYKKKRCWRRNANALISCGFATCGSTSACRSCARCRIGSCSSTRPRPTPS